MKQRHVSLLRGINVGGNNLIPMARLRSIYESLGCEDITTYLQSGNVVFRHKDDPVAVAAGVAAAIRDEFGFEIRILGRTHRQLAKVVAADPFPKAEPNRRIVLFLSEAPTAAIAKMYGHLHEGPDEAILIGEEIHVPDGMGRTRLMATLTDRRLGVTSTGRNWRTVTRLLGLSAG
jgi:uncharacterized protein (DUF1697 family)